MLNILHSQQIALLIDADNVQLSQLEQILKFAKFCGNLLICRAYGDWKQSPLSFWYNKISTLKIETIQVDRKGKNATDHHMVRQASEFLHADEVDAFIIVSGDGHFTSLCKQIKDAGRRVIGIGNKKHASIRLRKSCDPYVCIEDLENELELAKLDRDMIRCRDWNRSGLTFVTPDSELENLRLRIIREYGKDYELIVPPTKEELKAIQAESVRDATPIGELPNIEPRQMGDYTEADVVDVLTKILSASPYYNWRELQEVALILRRYFPDLNIKLFGYKGLRHLVQAYPKTFQTCWDNPKRKCNATIFIRLTKDHTKSS